MIRLIPIAVLLIAAALAGAQPKVEPTEVRALVGRLGSEEFSEREAASKRLDEIGAAALDALRAATRSDNPEIARRAKEIVRKIERRAANEKTLAPTLVELDAKDQRLDDVLGELSKQAKCEVVLNGPMLRELANKSITVATVGKVPFWVAVSKICDVAEVELARAGGFLAPDAMPYLAGAPRGVRVAVDASRAIVLEARVGAKRRPAAVFGAVMVEAIPFPKGTTLANSSVLLHMWPEPRLQWLAISGVTVGTATDGGGEKFIPETTLVATPQVVPSSREGVVMLRNPDGSVKFARELPGLPTPGEFAPNPRQAVVRFKETEKPSSSPIDLDIVLFGTVRSEIEPLSRVGTLELNKPAIGAGIPGAELTATVRKNVEGRNTADVKLTFDRSSVQHAGVGAELPGTIGGGPGRGNHSVHGVRITDADGKPYTLGLMSGSNRPIRADREEMALTLELHPDKDGHGAPAIVTFWGSYAKPVEVPVVLKNVPLNKSK